MSNTRPALNLKAAYERVKSKLTGVLADIAALWPIAKNSAGNGIYNGKFSINQKADITSATAVVSGTYQIDMLSVLLSTITATIQQVADGYEVGTNSVKLSATSSGNGYAIGQAYIEDYTKYAGKTITLSLLAKSNVSYAGYRFNDGTDWFYSNYHSGSGEWEELSITVDLSSSVSVIRMQQLLLDTSITSGDYIEFTDVRLLCKRYYQQFTGAQVYLGAGAATSVSNTYVMFHFDGEMRAIPTIVGTGAAHFELQGAAGNTASTAIAFHATSTKTARTQITTAAVLTAGDAVLLRTANVATYGITLAAEL